ncbi:hypothetical protein SNK04_014440 [Fusarium graminearum]
MAAAVVGRLQRLLADVDELPLVRVLNDHFAVADDVGRGVGAAGQLQRQGHQVVGAGLHVGVDPLADGHGIGRLVGPAQGHDRRIDGLVLVG